MTFADLRTAAPGLPSVSLPDRLTLPALLAALALLVVMPLFLVGYLNRDGTPEEPYALQADVEMRLPSVGSRDGTSWVIRSVTLSPHSHARWYLDVSASARRGDRAYEGSLQGVIAGSPCDPGPRPETAMTDGFALQGTALPDPAAAGTAALAVLGAATRIVTDACPNPPTR